MYYEFWFKEHSGFGWQSVAPIDIHDLSWFRNIGLASMLVKYSIGEGHFRRNVCHRHAGYPATPIHKHVLPTGSQFLV